MLLATMVSGTVFFSGYFVWGLEQAVNRKETVDVAGLNVGHRGLYTTVCLQCKGNVFLKGYIPGLSPTAPFSSTTSNPSGNGH